eukprot:353811_1
MAMFLLTSFFIVTAIVINKTYCYVHCFVAKECMQQVINDTGLISIQGYKAAFTAKSITSIANTIRCSGAFSCYNASSIYAHNGDIQCDGSHSCSYVSTISVNIDNTYAKIYCSASTSCHNTHFNAVPGVDCLGDQSCSNSLFDNTSKIYGYGGYSLNNATINSVHGLQVYFYGYHAGFGATLHCKLGHECNIFCGANGCSMLFVQCDGNCIITPNHISPNTADPIKNMLFFNLSALTTYYDSSAITTSNDELCDTVPTWTLDNRAEREDGANIEVINGDPICCRGTQSCNRISIIQSNSVTQYPIICSGKSACSHVNHIINKDEIICGGSFGCSYANISSNSIYCLGRSCTSSNIYVTQNLFCSARFSCQYSSIRSNGSINIYFIGYQSAEGTSIYCNVGDLCSVFCLGTLSCVSVSTMECLGNCIVQCNIDTGCPPGYTTNPSISPSTNPTDNPSISPTKYPSSSPTNNPSITPAKWPIPEPTGFPTKDPTPNPTDNPTPEPTGVPTNDPTHDPTRGPTETPSKSPTSNPSDMPTKYPTKYPSKSPTNNPSITP